MTVLRTLCSLLVLALAACRASSAPYSEAQGMTSLYLAIATFCPVEEYQSKTYVGPTEGFVATRTIEDPKTDATGFVGYLPSDRSIYVALRGSSSKKNWYSDLTVGKMNYTTFPECDCEVATGFYKAALSIAGVVTAEVKSLRLQFPSYRVKLTGHSYGAALSQLLAMELLAAGVPCSVYNFGQPRTGDERYATFASSRPDLETWRVVHNRDLVPHWPFNQGLGYFHVCREEFEDASGALRSCGGTPDEPAGFSTCEDPACSDQFDQPRDWRPEQHMTYLGVPISCDSVSE